MIKVSYDDVIEWMNAHYDDIGFDFLTESDIAKGRQALIDQFDTKGSIGAFFGIMRGSTESRIFQETEEPRFEETIASAIRSTDNRDDLKRIEVLDEFTQKTKDTLQEMKSSRFEELAGEDIINVATTENLADIKIPKDLTEEVIERLEEAKNVRFGEIRGDEIREEFENLESELSLKNIGREAKKIPDEDLRRDLIEEIKSEQRRTTELVKSFTNDIRSQTDETGLNDIISRIEDSDLRDRQKEGLRNIAEARRDLGFPEVTEV